MNGSGSFGEILPHGESLRFIQRVIEVGSRGAEVEALIGDTAPLAADGIVPAFMLLEAVAQSSAVHRALSGPGNGPGPRSGYLVGVRNAEFYRTTVPTCTSVSIRISMTGLAPPLGTFDFEVFIQQEKIATGSMSTYLEASGAGEGPTPGADDGDRKPGQPMPRASW